MQILLDYKSDIALLLVRLVLGILFLVQGYDKLFGMGLKRTAEGMSEAMRSTHIPVPVISFAVAVSSFIELIGGLLLIAGWYIIPVSVLLGADLFLVVLAMSLREPLWDMRFVWPRLVLLLLILLFPANADRISLDYFLNT